MWNKKYYLFISKAKYGDYKYFCGFASYLMQM